jgi:hypothetical protein
MYFGELTNSPNKGLSPFRPASLDLWFGQLLQLALRMNELTDVKLRAVIILPRQRRLSLTTLDRKCNLGAWRPHVHAPAYEVPARKRSIATAATPV